MQGPRLPSRTRSGGTQCAAWQACPLSTRTSLERSQGDPHPEEPSGERNKEEFCLADWKRVPWK